MQKYPIAFNYYYQQAINGRHEIMATMYITTDYSLVNFDATVTLFIFFAALVIMAILAWRAYRIKVSRQNFEGSLFNKIYSTIVNADPEIHKNKDLF